MSFWASTATQWSRGFTRLLFVWKNVSFQAVNPLGIKVGLGAVSAGAIFKLLGYIQTCSKQHNSNCSVVGRCAPRPRAFHRPQLNGAPSQSPRSILHLCEFDNPIIVKSNYVVKFRYAEDKKTTAQQKTEQYFADFANCPQGQRF